jgi:ABC-type Na+ efflux pump permease subunit
MAFLRANAVSGSLDMWSYLCLAGAIYLGASSIATELHSKRIITVLSHPVRRWELMIGKWLGVSAFGVVTLLIGIVLAYALSRYLGVNIETDVLAIAATRTIAGILLFAALATAVSTSGSTPVAVAITMLIAVLPGLIQPLRADSNPTYQRIGAALDAVVAPGYQSNYNGVVWAPMPVPPQMRNRMPAAVQQRPMVDYAEQRKQTAETAAYAGAYFLLGCVFFTRRDLKFS